MAPRSSRIARVLVVAMLGLPCAVARGEVTDEANATEEVVVSCLYHMGEFGADSIRACVDRDLSAVRGLSRYPDAVKEIVARCTRQMRQNGWSMVKACADRDIEAAAALAAYATEHEALVERCRTEMGKHGAAKVKACVDQAIESDEPSKKD